VIDAPIGDRALPGPGVEDRPDGLLELHLRILREVVEGLKGAREFLQRFHVQVGIQLNAAITLDARDLVLETTAIDTHDDIAEHLHEPSIRIPGKALIAGLGRKTGDALVVQAEVEDRVEHARHRLPRTGSDRDQERIARIAEALGSRGFEPVQSRADLVIHPLREAAVLHICNAGLSGDREAARDPFGPQNPRHLRDVCAFSPQQIAHLTRPVSKVVHPLRGQDL
jgi:hypothetical protein